MVRMFLNTKYSLIREPTAYALGKVEIEVRLTDPVASCNFSRVKIIRLNHYRSGQILRDVLFHGKHYAARKFFNKQMKDYEGYGFKVSGCIPIEIKANKKSKTSKKKKAIKFPNIDGDPLFAGNIPAGDFKPMLFADDPVGQSKPAKVVKKQKGRNVKPLDIDETISKMFHRKLKV